jgi:phospholipase C
MRLRVLLARLGAAATAFALAACAGGSSGASLSGAPPQYSAPPGASNSPITHIVVVIQENRTFNNLFATFPGTTGTTTGKMRTGTGSSAKTVSIALKEVALEDSTSLRHTYPGYKTAYRNGHMDGFNLITFEFNGKPEGTAPYQYVKPADVAPYWDIATDYGIADHMFQTQGSGSFTAHQDLIRGGTAITSTTSLIDVPSKFPWGCPAPYGTTTTLITTSLKYEPNAGPFPCTADFPSSKSYQTLQNLLDANNVSWKYYTPAYKQSTGNMWNAFLPIWSVFGNQAEWNAHISTPETNVFTDISSGALPSMSWIVPDAANSDHPGYASDTGPSWVASVVNAIGESKYWNSTAIVILWDDWGGLYDEVEPPKLDQQGGPGFRVPMLVVSPYVPANEISHTVYEFGSVVRFIEDTWNLGRLGTTDETTTSIANMLDLKQAPRAFITIPASRSRAFFLRQKPSELPVDTE